MPSLSQIEKLTKRALAASKARRAKKKTAKKTAKKKVKRKAPAKRRTTRRKTTARRAPAKRQTTRRKTTARRAPAKRQTTRRKTTARRKKTAKKKTVRTHRYTASRVLSPYPRRKKKTTRKKAAKRRTRKSSPHDRRVAAAYAEPDYRSMTKAEMQRELERLNAQMRARVSAVGRTKGGRIPSVPRIPPGNRRAKIRGQWKTVRVVGVMPNGAFRVRDQQGKHHLVSARSVT